MVKFFMNDRVSESCAQAKQGLSMLSAAVIQGLAGG
jgi:hypothetical protein